MRTPRILTLLATLVLAAPAGCSVEESDESATATGNLDGYRDRGFYPQVGRVEIIRGAANGGNESVICTATLVGTHTAITVADGCVEASGAATELERASAVTAQASEGAIVGAFFHGDHDRDLQIKKNDPKIVHPRSDSVPAQGGRAISSTFLRSIDRWERVRSAVVLHLRDAIPSDVTPAPLDDRTPERDDQLYAVGFTCPTAGAPDSGNQRVSDLYNWDRDGANAWDRTKIFMENSFGWFFGGIGTPPSTHEKSVDGKFDGVCLERDRGIATLRRSWGPERPPSLVALLADQSPVDGKVLAQHVVVAGATDLAAAIEDSESR